LIDRTDSYTATILVAFMFGVVAFALLHTVPIRADGRLERAPDR
jgi:hypothetical protein